MSPVETPAAPAANLDPVKVDPQSPFKTPPQVEEAPPAAEFFKRREARERGESIPPLSATIGSKVSPKPETPSPAPVKPAEPQHEPSTAARIFGATQPAAPVEAPPIEITPQEQFPEDKIEYKTRSIERGEQWKQLQGVAKELRKEKLALEAEYKKSVAELSGKIEKLEKTPAISDTKELERLKAEHESMSKKLAVASLQDHPEFQLKVLRPKAQALGVAAELVQAADLKDAPELSSLLKLSGVDFRKKLSEVATKMNPLDGQEFLAAMRQAKSLSDEGEKLLADADSVRANLSAQAELGSRQSFQSAWRSVNADELLVKVDPPETATETHRAQIAAYNKDLETFRTDAERIALSPQSPEQIATHAIKAAAYDRHIKHFLPGLLAENQRLTAELTSTKTDLAAIRGRKPSRDLNYIPSGGTPEPAGSKKLSEQSHADAARAVFGKRM